MLTVLISRWSTHLPSLCQIYISCTRSYGDVSNSIQALEAEAAYKASVAEANEFHAHMQKVKSVILQRVRELILQSDYILKSVTVTYFQLQQTLCTPLPTQVCLNREHDILE
jgi:hypothetical protein